MSDRFHIPAARWDPASLSLADDEARHCIQVMRHRAGDEIVVFNGVGDVARARITDIRKHAVALDCLATEHAEAAALRIALAPALIKAEPWEWMLEKVTELGVTAILPVVTERCVVQLDSNEQARKGEKWQRALIQAAKQSRRAWLPRLALPRPFGEVLGAAPGFDLTLMASVSPSAISVKTAADRFASLHNRQPSSAMVLIGPEGDFTTAETDLAVNHGFVPITLGPLTLRAETAAIAAAAVLANELAAREHPAP